MISPNYSILKPTVFVLTSIYAKVFEKRWRSQKGHVTSDQGQSIKNRRGEGEEEGELLFTSPVVTTKIVNYTLVGMNKTEYLLRFSK